MKKLICMICVLAMVLSMAACGEANKPADPTTEPSGTTAPTTSESNPTEPPKPADTTPETPTVPSEDDDEEAVPPVTEPSEEVEQPTEPSEPAEPSEPSEPTTKPTEPTVKPSEPVIKPAEPTVKPSEPTTKPTTPTNPPEEEEPAACTHKNTKFVEEIEPPTCMEYGYWQATVCTDCGAVVSYKDLCHYVDPDHWGLPTEHLNIVEGYGYCESTPVVEGYTGDTVCMTCDTIIEKGHALPLAPYFVGFELISESRPNAHMVDGTDMLTRMFGRGKVYQIGDSVTYRIVMSDGGTSGFVVDRWLDERGYTYTLEGNILTMTFTGHSDFGWFHGCEFSIETVDKDGNEIFRGIGADHLIGYTGNIAQAVGKSQYTMDLVLREFAQDNGVWFTTDRNSIPNYTNGDPSKSIYGTKYDFYSDMVPITDNPNWVKEIIELIEEYGRRGYNLVNWLPLESGYVHSRVGFSQEKFEALEEDVHYWFEWYGFKIVTDPNAVPSYTDGDPSLSYTGTADGYYDDVIMITGNPGWYTQITDLISEYEWYDEAGVLPINVVYITPFESGWIGVRAGYDPSLA